MSARHDAVINRILERARDPNRATWMAEKSPRLGLAEATASPPASAAEISEAERRLGVPIPEILARLYREVGNGGFGPGYGLSGLITGYFVTHGETAVPLWESWTARPRPAGYENWNWPATMLPIADWGCAIRSCVDIGKPQCPVYRFDPGGFLDTEAAAEEDMEATTAEGFAALFEPEAPALVDWLELWLDGTLEF
ncbi:MAG: SMI1/KNR4 family protein [Sandaracinus sp.]